MTRPRRRIRRQLALLWHTDRPLTGTGVLMLGALATALAGLAIDPRLIDGAPAWLKPAKFAASIAIYTLTLAWISTYLPEWTRVRRSVGWVTAVTLILELVIIGAQAWRGTTSHFNVGTPLDMALWTTMGAAIVVQTLTSLMIAYAVWRQPFRDRALGWALRLGLAITIVSASAGGLMTRPTGAQLADARSGAHLTVVGAHTVGAPDGGPGLPGTGWSLRHGDLRVAHFVGLHAIQALPIVALLFSARRWPDHTRVRLTMIGAGSYAALWALLLWQALRGQALVQPDAATLIAGAIWITLTIVSAWLATLRRYPVPAHVV